MTLNDLIALILLYFTESDSLCRPITSQWLKIDLYCLQNIVFHFWPKLTHPAARFVCDSWTTCFTVDGIKTIRIPVHSTIMTGWWFSDLYSRHSIDTDPTDLRQVILRSRFAASILHLAFYSDLCHTAYRRVLRRAVTVVYCSWTETSSVATIVSSASRPMCIGTTGTYTIGTTGIYCWTTDVHFSLSKNVFVAFFRLFDRFNIRPITCYLLIFCSPC